MNAEQARVAQSVLEKKFGGDVAAAYAFKKQHAAGLDRAETCAELMNQEAKNRQNISLHEKFPTGILEGVRFLSPCKTTI